MFRLAVLALGWLIICAQALPLLAQLKISASQAAVRASDTGTALEAADAARALEPWAASPYLQLALVEEQSGEIRSALAFIHDAIRRDRSDWRLWLVAARLQVKAGRPDAARTSVARVEALNPRSPLLAPLYRVLSP
jgi:Tfp pilus assembly protein PilF